MTDKTKDLLNRIIDAERSIVDNASSEEEAKEALLYLFGYSSAISDLHSKEKKVLQL